MSARQSRASIRHLLLALLITPQSVLAGPYIPSSLQAGFSFNELFARYECDGQICGYYSTVCCTGGLQCSTNAATQAVCGYGGGVSTQPSGGYWTYYTTTYTQTDLETITQTMSSYIQSVSGPAATPSCHAALNEQPCGNICCAGNQYCANPQDSQCMDTEASTSERVSSWVASRTVTRTVSQTPAPPLRGTSSSISITTQTSSPTRTIPFQTPIATGANITISGSSNSSSGLSGGDIAGIVIGSLVGAFLLAVLCAYCCLKGLWDGFLAIFGLGGDRRRRVTEVEEYERYSRHDSRNSRTGAAAAAAGGRTWYGARRPPPPGSRVDQREKRDSHFVRDAVGIGAALAAFWAILGLKRRNERKTQVQRYGNNNGAYSEYSYYSDEYYTSASSASSDDRRTRATRDSRRIPPPRR